jgi:hypothetical protein
LRVANLFFSKVKCSCAGSIGRGRVKSQQRHIAGQTGHGALAADDKLNFAGCVIGVIEQYILKDGVGLQIAG